MNRKLILISDRESVELGAEHFNGASCDIGTEISVELVYMLNVYEGNRILGCNTCCKHLVKS